jgi:hypothetical protein
MQPTEKYFEQLKLIKNFGFINAKSIDIDQY